MRFMRIAAGLVVVSLLLLAGCPLQGTLDMQDSAGAGPVPTDSANDTLRVYSSSFAYQTLLPVEVGLSVLDSNSNPLEGALVTLTTRDGAAVLRGRSDEAGTYAGVLVLPSAPQSVTLAVSARGHETRRITIHDMVQYSSVRRTIYLAGEPYYVGAQSLQDTDGDGVPDAFDDFPNDSERAFLVRVPAEDTITVAFEDLFPRFDRDDPQRFFDADFNDFVANYVVEEIYNSDNLLVELRGEATAVAKMAGYNHRFGMLFRFEGKARLEVAHFSRSGTLQERTESVIDTANIVLFESTNNSIGRTASFTLRFSTPLSREVVTAKPYDPYLYVHNTGVDIHQIGMESLPDSENPVETDDWLFRHPVNGMPWALLVPTDWQPPAEMQHIEEVYPAFRYWRESFGKLYPDWYLYFKQDPGPPQEAVPPPPVSAVVPEPVPINWEDPTKVRTYQLSLQESDPGAYFRTEQVSLPDWIALDEIAGVVTVNTGALQLDLGSSVRLMVEFYSSYNEDRADDDALTSTMDRPFMQTFEVFRPADL